MRFLFVDRILDSVPGERIQGLKHITSDDYYLMSDTDNGWQFMPSLIGETLGQLAAWNVMAHNEFTARPVAGVVAQVQMSRPATPGSTMLLEAQIEKLDDTAVQYNARATVNGKRIAQIDGALGPLMPMDDFIDQDTVKQQYAEIYRPGELPDDLRPFTLSTHAPASVCAQPDFDALLAFTPAQSMQMLKHISRAAPYFPDHFPRKPVLPMTMLIQSKISMAARFIQESSFEGHWDLSRLERIKMNTFVYPGDSVCTTLKVKDKTTDALILRFQSEVAGKRVCVMEAVFEPRE